MENERNITGNGEGAEVSAEERRLEVLLSQMPRRRAPTRIRENVLAALRAEAEQEMPLPQEAPKAEVVSLWFRRRILRALQAAAVLAVVVIGTKIYLDMKPGLDVGPREPSRDLTSDLEYFKTPESGGEERIRKDLASQYEYNREVVASQVTKASRPLEEKEKSGSDVVTSSRRAVGGDADGESEPMGRPAEQIWSKAHEMKSGRGLADGSSRPGKAPSKPAVSEPPATEASILAEQSGFKGLGKDEEAPAGRKPASATPRQSNDALPGLGVATPKGVDTYALGAKGPESTLLRERQGKTHETLDVQSRTPKDKPVSETSERTDDRNQLKSMEDLATLPIRGRRGEGDRSEEGMRRSEAAQARESTAEDQPKTALAPTLPRERGAAREVNGSGASGINLKKLSDTGVAQRAPRLAGEEDLPETAAQQQGAIEGTVAFVPAQPGMGTAGGGPTSSVNGAFFDNLEWVEVLSSPVVERQIIASNSIDSIRLSARALGEFQEEDRKTTWPAFRRNAVTSFNTLLVNGFGGYVNRTADVVLEPGQRPAVVVECSVPDQNGDALIAAVNQKRLLARQAPEADRLSGAIDERHKLGGVTTRAGSESRKANEAWGTLKASVRKMSESEVARIYLATTGDYSVSNYYVQVPPEQALVAGDGQYRRDVVAGQSAVAATAGTELSQLRWSFFDGSRTVSGLSATSNALFAHYGETSPALRSEALHLDKTATVGAQIQAPPENRLLNFILEPDRRLNLLGAPPAAAAKIAP